MFGARRASVGGRFESSAVLKASGLTLTSHRVLTHDHKKAFAPKAARVEREGKTEKTRLFRAASPTPAATQPP